MNLPQPVVAVVQGPAAGVGASLALACDVVLASEKAFFMLAFTKIGLMPDGGASALIAASVGRHRAMRMALLAERIPAAEAYEWGLVTAVYPADQFDAEVDKVVATLVSGPAVALRKTKDAINAATLTELETALEREKQGQLVLISWQRLPRGHQGLSAAQAREVHRLLNPDDMPGLKTWYRMRDHVLSDAILSELAAMIDVMDQYTFRAEWSPETAEYVGMCLEYPVPVRAGADCSRGNRRHRARDRRGSRRWWPRTEHLLHH